MGMNIEQMMGRLDQDGSVEALKLAMDAIPAELAIGAIVERMSPADLDELIANAERKIIDAFERRGEEVPVCKECGRME